MKREKLVKEAKQILEFIEAGEEWIALVNNDKDTIMALEITLTCNLIINGVLFSGFKKINS